MRSVQHVALTGVDRMQAVGKRSKAYALFDCALTAVNSMRAVDLCSRLFTLFSCAYDRLRYGMHQPHTLMPNI